MTAPVHPGGWVDGIGWVALGSSLGPSDLFARWQGDPPRPKHPYRMCDRTPVIVTCWADGTVPTWVPSHPDSIQFRLRQFTPHHPVASGRQAMMDAADALDVTHCADGSTPQAPTVDEPDLGPWCCYADEVGVYADGVCTADDPRHAPTHCGYDNVRRGLVPAPTVDSVPVPRADVQFTAPQGMSR